ncbi:MAG: cellulase family glycosylhydrolase [Archangium sp.]
MLLLLLVACVPPKTEPPPARTFSVSNGFIRDPDGRAVILRGANVSGRHKDPPYFDFHETPDFERMRDEWGMNSVRFLISWAALEPTRDAYDDAYLDEVVRKVKLATDAGLLVFLDMHQDLYGVGFPGGNGMPRWTCDESKYASYRPGTTWFFNYLSAEVTACFDGFWGSRDLHAKYAAAWSHVAQRFVDAPLVIGFDPMNEPYWGSYQPDLLEQGRLASLYRDVIAAVRVHRPDWLAFLEPVSSRNIGLPSKLPTFSEGNVVYAPHSYDGTAEQGMGFDPTRRSVLMEQIAKMRTEADARNAALVLGEYGGMTNTPGISEYMDAEYDAAGLQRAGAMYWDYGKNDGYALLSADGTPKADLLAMVARPYPARVAGEPGAWAVDGDTFTFRYAPNFALTVPTVIRVPTGTFTATCDGCTVEAKSGAFELTPTSGVTEVHFTLTR